MSLPFSVGGARAYVPGVYDYFHVQDSLPAAVPGAQNLFIFGEAESGIPSSLLDPTLNFFTSYSSVLAYYGSGPIVDACRQAFTTQPSPAFNSSVNRVYIYKTNQTTRAERQLTSPSNYGFLASYVWNEAGNLIKTQIVSAQAEVKPTISFESVITSASNKIEVMISGTKCTTSTLATLALPSAVASALTTAVAANATVSGGAIRTIFVDDLASIALVALGDMITLTLTPNAGASTLSSVQANDTLLIPIASSIVAAGLANAGAYIVISSANNVVVAQKVHSLATGGVDSVYVAPISISFSPVIFALGVQLAWATAEVMIFSPITITVTQSTVSGSAATLEILESNASTLGARMILDYENLSPIISAATASVATISAIATGSSLAITLANGVWITVPSIGSLIQIPDGSLLADVTNANVGLFLVTASGPLSLSLTAIQSATLVSIPSVALASSTDFILSAPAIVSTSLTPITISSASESEVEVLASRVTDNAVWPTTAIGGNVALEIGYWDGVATAATLSISAKSIMTISFTGGSIPTVTIPMLKLQTLISLVTYINSLPGFAAALVSKKDGSLPVTVLDQVTSLHILSGSSMKSLNGRIKRDWYDWNQSFLNNTGSLLAFGAGTASLKVGLPAIDATASFLSGAAIGGTSGADISLALDAALKLPTSQVIPLFSRDAAYDIQDGLTDASSSYQIDAIHSLVQSHVATASGVLVKKERFGCISYHSDFASTETHAQAFSYERLQMAFQMARSVSSDGTVQFYLPWMLSVVSAAGRTQAALGSSLLRKNFNVSQVKHIGNLAPYSDTLVTDFDANDNRQLTSAIESGLLTFNTTAAGGVQVVSPDLSTRSRTGDPQGWVWERVNVLFCCDQVRAVLRNNLENFIGSRTTDITPSQVQKVANDRLNSFVRQGNLISGVVDSITSLGNEYDLQVSIMSPESLEAIVLGVTAKRSVSA